MQAFLTNNTDPKQWQQAADYLNGLLKNNERAELRTAFTQISNTVGWPSLRYAYTLSRMDADGLVALCADKILNWQGALNAKACFGSADDVQKIYQTGQQHGFGFNLNDTLGYSCHSIFFVPGLKSPGNLETTEELFKLGASPGHNSGNLFETGVDECGVEMGSLFARYGLAANIISNKMYNASSNGKTLLHKQLREIYLEYGRYTVADHETLLENKTLLDNNNQLKIIFNFSARRVSEIYEWPGKSFQPVVRDFSFDDYGQAAVEKARQKLIEMGGHPSDDTGKLAGKTIIKPLGNKLTKENPSG